MLHPPIDRLAIVETDDREFHRVPISQILQPRYRADRADLTAILAILAAVREPPEGLQSTHAREVMGLGLL